MKFRKRSPLSDAQVHPRKPPAPGTRLLAAFSSALAPVLALAVSAFATSNRLGLAAVGALTAAIVLGLIIARTALHRLFVDPLRMLTASVRAIDHGELPARCGLPHDSAEFGTLAEAFDRMVEILRERSLEAARDHRALRRHADRLDCLRRIGVTSHTSATIKPVATKALDELQRLVSYNQAVIEEWDAAPGQMRMVAMHPAFGVASVSPTTAGGGIEALREGEPIVVNDVDRLPHASAYARAVRDKGVGAYMVVPLRGTNDIVGVLTVTAEHAHAFSPDDVALVQEIADQVAGAIVQARIRDEAAVKSEELARTVQILRSADDGRKELLTRLVGAQEEERRRIASDVHDDPLQVMTAANLRLQMLRRMIVDPEPAQMLAQLEANVRQAIARLRNLLFQLRPPALDRQGLAPAIRLCLEQLASELTVEHSLENRLGAEPAPEIRTVLYRIAQEAITNVRKHAMAEHISVLLAYENNGYLVRVRDDGRGFDPGDDERARPGHLGIFTMRERAEIAGGRISIESAPGNGTTVEFWLPGDQADPAVAS